MTADRTARIQAALQAARKPAEADGRQQVSICAGTSCHASGRLAFQEALEHELAERGLTDQVRIV